MEFLLDRVEYGVAEFYETFCHQIPMLVMVTAGYCSDFMAETFDQGQILRIHTCSQQKRVVARQTTRLREHLFSLPLNYPINFCVPKSFGKVKREQTLKEIVETGSLPMVVQFVKGHEFYLGSKKVSTDTLSALNLTNTFEETYFLSNTVYEGTLDQNLIPIPLYLKDLRLCRIVSFENQSKSDIWDDFLKVLDKQSTHLIYDQTYGNEDIAVYNQKDIHSVSHYEYLQPSRYSDLSVLYDTLNSENYTSDIQEATMPKSANVVRRTKKTDAQIYTTLRPMSVQESTVRKSSNVVLTNVKKTDAHIYTTLRPMSVHDIKSRPTSEIKLISASETALIDQLKTALKTGTLSKDDLYPPPVYPKPTVHSSTQLQGAPYLSARRKKIQTPLNEIETLKGDNSSDSEKHNSINSKGETQNTFYQELPDFSLAVSQAKTSNEILRQPRTWSHVDVISQKTANPVIKETERDHEHVTEVHDVSSQLQANPLVSELTIDQVGQYLKVLGLNHYVDTFKHNCVDGMILGEFNETMLVEELGFKKLESIKLMQFIRKGHIPK